MLVKRCLSFTVKTSCNQPSHLGCIVLGGIYFSSLKYLRGIFPHTHHSSVWWERIKMNMQWNSILCCIFSLLRRYQHYETQEKSTQLMRMNSMPPAKAAVRHQFSYLVFCFVSLFSGPNFMMFESSMIVYHCFKKFLMWPRSM